VLQTTSLPINWVLLNGSDSKDDIGIKSYLWKQLSGPNNAVILKSNSSVSAYIYRYVGPHATPFNPADCQCHLPDSGTL